MIKVVNIQRLSANVLLHFTIMYVYFICMIQTLYDSGLLSISSQSHIQCPHFGGLKSEMVGGFTPRILASPANQVLMYCLIDFYT